MSDHSDPIVPRVAQGALSAHGAPRRSAAYILLSVLATGILWFFCATYIYPFVWLLYNSFKNQAQFALNIFSLPSPPTGKNYADIFTTPDVYVALFNSAFNTLGTIVLVVLCGFPTAYILSRYSFRARNLLYSFFLTGLLVPVLALLIPSYIQFHALNMLDHRYTLIIPYVTFNLPTTIYLYDSYIRPIPRAIEEAAFIDGAKMSQIMRWIVFPMSLPMTVTIVILNFLFNWNEFPFALVLNAGLQYHTVPIWLTMFQGLYAGNIPGRLTAMLIACLPIMIAYVFLREKMMRGLTAGAIRG